MIRCLVYLLIACAAAPLLSWRFGLPAGLGFLLGAALGMASQVLALVMNDRAQP